MRNSNKRKIEIAGLQAKLADNNKLIASLQQAVSNYAAEVKRWEGRVDDLSAELAVATGGK